MTFEGYFTLFVIVLMMIALVRSWASTDAIFFGALCALMFGGVLTPAEALSGFANPGLALVAILFIISAGIQNTGALNHLVYHFLSAAQKRYLPLLSLKLMAPIVLLSAFINNTSLVIIFVPIVRSWSEKIRISASKFFIPLSYAAILGGLCSLIGTSTNLVVHGLMLENGFRGMGMFEVALVGIPCAVAGIIYMAFFGIHLLPNRKDLRTVLKENKKEYVVEMKVLKGCELIGKSVQQAGLRNLRGLFLIDIERDGESLGPITSHEVMRESDRLMFVGLTTAVVELQDIPGLMPAAEGLFEKDFASMSMHLVEAVVSATSPILGQTVKDANFRGKYGAGVVAVHRNGERIQSKIGSIQLRPGDTLLLLASPEFLKNWRDSQDFYLISTIKTKAPDAHRKSWTILLIFAGMIIFAAQGPSFIRLGDKPFHVLHAVAGAAILMVLTRCLPVYQARKAIRWDILITIACGFGISKALLQSGVADKIAGFMISHADGIGPYGILAAIYLLTLVTTEVITNNAAAAMVFPIAVAAAQQMGISPYPLFFGVAIAASASFLTPIGYQTNLMVQGPGGYRFSDYTKAGTPLSIICFLISMILIPYFWKF